MHSMVILYMSYYIYTIHTTGGVEYINTGLGKVKAGPKLAGYSAAVCWTTGGGISMTLSKSLV